MDGEQINLWTQIIAGIVGGFLSGGLVVGWIELKRYKREKIEWERQDKKIDLGLVGAHATQTRWQAEQYSDQQDKLRIFETGLQGKIRYWKYLVKISISNLTDRDILALTLDLEVSQPNIEKAPSMSSKYKVSYEVPYNVRYDLMEKDLIEKHDLPFVIPASSTTGVVFLGRYAYDYPSLVENVPINATFKMKTSDGKEYELPFIFEFVENLPEIFLSEKEEMHWTLYMDKNNIGYFRG